jgi:chaperonin GroEL
MSSPKEILFEEEARSKLQQGMKQAAQAVRMTLGPKGRNVGVGSSFGEPKITSDGHSILCDIELSDTFENMGVAIAKEAASKMKEKCGDGTTTTTILLDQMVQHGSKLISSGASPIDLKRGMEKSVELLLQALDKGAIAIENEQQIQKIAQVSASGNQEIGEMICQAISKVGKEGVITIDEGKSTQTTLEIVEGLQFDRGYVSPYFVNQPEKMATEFEKPLVLITDRKISSIHDLLNLLQGLAASSRPLVIIADDVEAEALSTLVVNNLRGILKVVAVKAPGFGDRRKALLEDIAIVTGATVVTEDKGIQLKDTSLDMLGQADKITVTKESTTLVASKGHQEEIEKRVRQIERELENCQNKYDKEKLFERKAKLLGGVAVIKVGASSESALKHLKQKYEDSLNSTRAALESGIVIGAGMALAHSRDHLKLEAFHGDEALGAQIILEACLAPARQIIDNAGFDGRVVIAGLLKDKNPRLGFNVLHDTVEDLIQNGVIDAVKVVKNSLIHASSAACVALLTEALIADAKDEE